MNAGRHARFGRTGLGVLAFVALLSNSPAGRASDEWVFPPAAPVRILAMRGLWYDFYGMDRAWAALGGVRQADIWHSGGGIFGALPRSDAELAGQHLVVIANINAKAIPTELQAGIKRFVENGGGLLMLGGYYAFGEQYHGTPLEEIAPVFFAAGRDLVWSRDGAALAAGDGEPAVAVAADWSAKPRLYWRHEVTPKPNANVLLTADGKPVLIVGGWGKGRVAVFAGSVMGEPAVGHLPFWSWADWPGIMADLATWLTEFAAGAGPQPDAGFAGRLEAALQTAGADRTNRLAAIRSLGGRVGDASAAQALLKATVAVGADIDGGQAEALFQAVRSFACKGLAADAAALAASGYPVKTKLGLRLMGACGGDGVRELLTNALVKGDVQVRNVARNLDDLMDDVLTEVDAGGGGLRADLMVDPGAVEADVERARLIRLGALEGLGELGDAAALPLIRDAFREADECYQTALLAALRCGESEAAGPAVDALMGNLYTLAAMSVAVMAGNSTTAKADKKKALQAAAAAARLRVFQETCYGRMRYLPETVLPALAARVAAEEDSWVAPLAFAVFGSGFNDGRAIQEAVAVELRKAKVAAVADLTRRRRCVER